MEMIEIETKESKFIKYLDECIENIDYDTSADVCIEILEDIKAKFKSEFIGDD